MSSGCEVYDGVVESRPRVDCVKQPLELTVEPDVSVLELKAVIAVFHVFERGGGIGYPEHVDRVATAAGLELFQIVDGDVSNLTVCHRRRRPSAVCVFVVGGKRVPERIIAFLRRNAWIEAYIHSRFPPHRVELRGRRGGTVAQRYGLRQVFIPCRGSPTPVLVV